MATPHGHRREQRPAWLRMAFAPVRVLVHVLVPVLVPMLLAAVVLGLVVARDAEPSGLGEPATGLVPGAVTVTGWHRSDVALVPAGFGPRDPGHASPQALVDTMVADARQAAGGDRWITGTIISGGADAAKARVYLPPPGYSEASVAAELLLELALKSDGWYVHDAHARFHCRQAVRTSFCG